MQARFRIRTLKQTSTDMRWYNCKPQGMGPTDKETHLALATYFLLNWRTLQDRQKDVLLSTMYRIEKSLVAIKKDKKTDTIQEKD